MGEPFMLFLKCGVVAS